MLKEFVNRLVPARRAEQETQAQYDTSFDRFVKEIGNVERLCRDMARDFRIEGKEAKPRDSH